MSNDSFEAIVSEHLHAAYNLARWLTRDPVLAEDVVQDAMLRALTYFRSYRGENPRAWLLRIVRNVALSRLESQKATAASVAITDEETLDERHELADPSPSAEALIERTEAQGMIGKLLAALPLDLRECLILRELEELSYKEIARIVDAPLGTVMSRLWRARQLLVQSARAMEQP